VSAALSGGILGAWFGFGTYCHFFRRGRSSERPTPTQLAEFLLGVFARAKDIESLMGDFEGLFAGDCASEWTCVAPKFDIGRG
jgi:hypothetical protein